MLKMIIIYHSLAMMNKAFIVICYYSILILLWSVSLLIWFNVYLVNIYI